MTPPSLGRSRLSSITSTRPRRSQRFPNPAAINENAGLQTVNLSGISAGPGDTQTLQVTATSDLTSVIPNPTVVYTSPKRHRLDHLHAGRQ